MRGQIRIRGTCMEPTLIEGASVSVVPQAYYLPGDVIISERSDGYQAHRVLGYRPSRQGWAVITQADDTTNADPAVVIERIIGRAEVPVPLARRLQALVDYGKALVMSITRARR